MQFTLKETRLGLRNSTTRIPFRYGNTCLTRCPQAVLQATLEARGKVVRGYSGDCLPPGWFDKTPGRGFHDQIDDMLAAISLAQAAFQEAARRPVTLFACWLSALPKAMRQAAAADLNPLLASFGASLVERALIDAIARAAGLSFAAAVRYDLFSIEPGMVHASLNGLKPVDWLPKEPVRSVFARHTIGLSDPLTTVEIPPEERLADGFPQSVEEYIQRRGTRYFKFKLANQPQRDRQRLLTLAELSARYLGADYRLTLDGNEQYKHPADFDALVEMLRGTPGLQTLLANTLAIEQPLDRKIALDERHTGGIRALSRFKPVIIDESDATLMSYQEALDLGYRGVSTKNCKGAIKSLLNAGLTWLRNDRGRLSEFLMTGEDLCSVGVIPTQADLCLAATLGLTHVERNGHHYHPGLSYLPESYRRAALAAHPDFYAEEHGVITPNVQHGRMEIGSLQCTGFGFAALPDMADYVPADEWQYDSLGLEGV